MTLGETLTHIDTWRKKRSVRTVSAALLVVLGPTLVVVTYLGLSTMDLDARSPLLRVILLVDLIYVLVVATLIALRIMHLFHDRRAKSAGSRLHARLSLTFALVALVPTVIVAVFATITLNLGLEGWFSDRVRDVVGSSLSAAEAYETEQQDDLISDLRLMSALISAEKRRDSRFVFDGDLVLILSQIQPRIQRGIKEAYIIDGLGEIRARGDRSYLFDYEQPAREEIIASTREPLVIKDWESDEFRALTLIKGFADRYLYISRTVDGDILNLLDDTKQTIAVYNQLENDRGRVLFELGLLYLGFAVIIILSATWLGLIFAERIARPVGRLAGAARSVGAGDFSIRVEEEAGDDELAILGRMFNRMTQQVERQRDDLIEAHDETENRRRLFDSVLSGVTAGVIGLTSDGRIEVLNAAARDLLSLSKTKAVGRNLATAVPEFSTLFDQVKETENTSEQKEVSLTRGGNAEILLVRMAQRINVNGDLEGYVVTFDDVTKLVSAQRMAAWGDVARRIAHEIKNPLTPIQLSAERMKRKFSPMLGNEGPALDQYSDVIIRQTNDLRRIVDEFSKFARMPEPDMKLQDITQIVNDIYILQQTAHEDITLTRTGLRKPIYAQIDDTMIGQAITNLMKNAAEAIETRRSNQDNFTGAIKVRATTSDKQLRITISDNGIGLPKEKRSRLFEPYVTNREGGTGLGLSIVRKIIEEHGGTLELTDASKFKGDTHAGAQAIITLPIVEQTETPKSAQDELAA
jgi:two-component system nitrogen regulation sensor histidine kinase NtrY